MPELKCQVDFVLKIIWSVPYLGKIVCKTVDTRPFSKLSRLVALSIIPFLNRYFFIYKRRRNETMFEFQIT